MTWCSSSPPTRAADLVHELIAGAAPRAADLVLELAAGRVTRGDLVLELAA